MPKRTDIKKIMVIGSGPIVIGQAAEFDYAGTQACIALKEEGYKVILHNSNPATIMTDVNMAEKVYMEPLDLEHVARIVRYERPDGIICGLGGQTGLNLGMQLYKKGILEECRVQVLGSGIGSIEKAEDRKLFKELCLEIGEPMTTSVISTSAESARAAAKEIGYPVVLRPAFTLGGTGGGFADNENELNALIGNALTLSPVGQVLIEKSIKGFKEIEFEVVRDGMDNAIVVCGMENVDPVGVHTGDSVVVAPTQTLNETDLNMLRQSALRIVRALKIEGACNVQFALSPTSSEYYVIEVNPRVSRSSALASKAVGFPIARIAAKIACGLTLDEIKIGDVTAAHEPVPDYVICKYPRFPFDKFSSASRKLSTQMKATGEVMSIGRSMEEVFLKGVRSLEQKMNHLSLKKLKTMSKDELVSFIQKETDERMVAMTELLRRGYDVSDLAKLTQFTPFFVEKLQNIVDMEKQIAGQYRSLDVLKAAKKMGFGDEYIGEQWGMNQTEMYHFRVSAGVMPSFKMINTSGKKDSYIPCFYSCYGEQNESRDSGRQKVIVLGSGPIRIGQGVEFDYSTVHAVWSISKMGYEAIIINNNPETVSTDYTLSDKLYFEPLTFEDVMNIIAFEKPIGVICALGGQTAINLAGDLEAAGVNILGTGSKVIDLAEDRDLFNAALNEINIPMPAGHAVFNVEDARNAAKEIGYPVLVRPSFVLGGRMMHIVYEEESLAAKVAEAVEFNPKHPVLVDKYILGKECEVDAVCDGTDVFIPGIMEHIERAGVHSGDSISVYPPFSLSQKVKETIADYTTRIGLHLKIVGPFNIQFVVDKSDKVYIIEVNPRSSRTVPFLAKTTLAPVADIASQVLLGKKLKDLGYTGMQPPRSKWFVKMPTFSFSKLAGLDAVLSPEMKSTGEAIGYDVTLSRALYKAMVAGGIRTVNYGTVFVTVAQADREEALPIVKRFYDLGFNIVATEGTGTFLKEHGIRTRILKRISEGSDEILHMLRRGYIAYVINTSSGRGNVSQKLMDGAQIRWTATENKVPLFTSLDTVKALLDVLEEITMRISTIDK